MRLFVTFVTMSSKRELVLWTPLPPSPSQNQADSRAEFTCIHSATYLKLIKAVKKSASRSGKRLTHEPFNDHGDGNREKLARLIKVYRIVSETEVLQSNCEGVERTKAYDDSSRKLVSLK